MDRKNRRPFAQKNQRALMIVWLALLLAMFAYTATVFLFEADRPALGETVKTAFLAGGILLGAGSLFVYRFSLSEKSLRKKFAATRGLSPEKRLEEFSDGLLLPHVVPWGMNECVLLLGFVLAFISKDPWAIAPFSAIGGVLQVYMYPRTEELLEKTKDFD